MVAATESDIPHVSPLYLPYISPTSPQVLLVAANESDVHGAVVRQARRGLAFLGIPEDEQLRAYRTRLGRRAPNPIP